MQFKWFANFHIFLFISGARRITLNILISRSDKLCLKINQNYGAMVLIGRDDVFMQWYKQKARASKVMKLVVRSGKKQHRLELVDYVNLCNFMSTLMRNFGEELAVMSQPAGGCLNLSMKVWLICCKLSLKHSKKSSSKNHSITHKHPPTHQLTTFLIYKKFPVRLNRALTRLQLLIRHETSEARD